MALRAVFPDMRWDVEEQMAEDTRVLTRFVWHGTHRGDFLGIPPTQKSVSVSGMVIDRFDGAKIKSTRILMDTLSLMQQLVCSPTRRDSASATGTSGRPVDCASTCAMHARSR